MRRISLPKACHSETAKARPGERQEEYERNPATVVVLLVEEQEQALDAQVIKPADGRLCDGAD